MKITRKAEKDIDKQEDFDRQELSKKIKRLLTESRETADISYIEKPDFDVEFHRLKVKDGELDHRAYFEYQNSEIVVFAVRHRDHAYTEEDIKQARQRLEDLEL